MRHLEIYRVSLSLRILAGMVHGAGLIASTAHESEGYCGEQDAPHGPCASTSGFGQHWPAFRRLSYSDAYESAYPSDDRRLLTSFCA